jgi:hypothetical protein
MVVASNIFKLGSSIEDGESRIAIFYPPSSILDVFVSCSWMRLIVNRGQLIQIQMGVALGRREARMTEHLLNHAQIGTAVEQMRRKSVAQTMRTNLDLYPDLPQMLLQQPRNAPSGNSAASIVQKNRIFAFARPIPLLPYFYTIVPERVECHLADGHDPFF